MHLAVSVKHILIGEVLLESLYIVAVLTYVKLCCILTSVEEKIIR